MMIKLQAGSQPRYNSDMNWDHKGRTEISHIYISYDFGVIRFIQFQYVEESGVLSKPSPMPFVYSDASRFNVVKLDYPHEFLKGISGQCDGGNVKSLTFTTNRGNYGPFGSEQENRIEFDFQTGDEPLFAGLHGTFDCDGLATIGIYVNPEKASL